MAAFPATLSAGRKCGTAPAHLPPVARPMIITSRSNPRIKLARSLSGARARRDSGLALIEGFRDVSAAAETNTRFHSLIYDSQKVPSATIQRLANTVNAVDLDIISVSPDVFSSLSRQNNPPDMAAIVDQQWGSLDSLMLSSNMYCIALYSIRDPGNLGTIIRTSEAVSSQGVVLIDASTDPYHPMALRAAAGSLFYQSIVRTTFDDIVRWKSERGLSIVGASQAAPDDYRTFEYPDPAIVLMGNERAGLPVHHHAVCDATVKIPMSGHTESLNLSVAASLILYELFDRRRNRPAGPSP